MNRILLPYSLIFRLGGWILAVLFLTGAELKPGDILLQEGAAYRAEGRQLQDVGDLRRALAAFRMAVAVNPGYAEAYNDLGVVLESLGQNSEAEQAYRRSLDLKPELASAHSNIALLYEQSGRLKEAAEHWSTRIRMGPAEDPWVLKAREKLSLYNVAAPGPPVEPPVSRQKKEVPPEGKRLLERAQARERKTEERRQKEIEKAAARAARQAQGSRKVESVKPAEGVKPTIRPKERVRVVPPKVVAPAPRKQIKPAREAVKTREVAPPALSVPDQAHRVAAEYAKERSRVRQKSTQELSQRALSAMRDGRYDEALDVYKQILALDPGSRDARQGLERAQKAKAKAAQQAGRGL